MVTAAAAAKSLQSCPTLCDPIDGSPPGAPIPGILQATTLEWVAISFSKAWKWKAKVKLLSCVRLLATPWTAAYQAPPPMGFSRQEYWSGVTLPSPADGYWSHEIRRHLLFGRKAMTNLGSILKSKDFTLLTKDRLVKAMVFPVVMYGCKRWSIKKAESQRTIFKSWCWRRFLRVPWTAWRSNQSIIKEINPEYSLEGLMLKLKLNTSVTWSEEQTHWKRPWFWERLKKLVSGGEWDG